MVGLICMVGLIGYYTVDLVVGLTGCYRPGGRPDMHGRPERLLYCRPGGGPDRLL